MACFKAPIHSCRKCWNTACAAALENCFCPKHTSCTSVLEAVSGPVTYPAGALVHPGAYASDILELLVRAMLCLSIGTTLVTCAVE